MFWLVWFNNFGSHLSHIFPNLGSLSINNCYLTFCNCNNILVLPGWVVDLYHSFLAADLPCFIWSSLNSIILYIPSGIFSLAASQLLGPLVEGNSTLLLKSIPIKLCWYLIKFVPLTSIYSHKRLFEILGPHYFLSHYQSCHNHIFIKNGEEILQITLYKPNFVQGTWICYSFCLKIDFHWLINTSSIPYYGPYRVQNQLGDSSKWTL